MPKSDTWPGGVAIQSLNNMDSAGSCDSVISMNSGCSEDSMEHLSPEERACLMYLEETIEALEVQEDSGLSNDESDYSGKMRINDITNFKPEESGGGQISSQAGLPALNQASEPLFSSGSAANTTDLETSENLTTQPRLHVTDVDSIRRSEIHPPASQTTELCVSKDEHGNLRIVPSSSLSPGHSAKAPEMELALIPPPSDFMDEPQPPPQLLKAKDLLPHAGVSNNKPGATIDLEQLRERASVKRHSMSSHEPPNKPHELSPLAISSVPPLSLPPEAAELRSPPAVAPKPKKLPANIILKSHKAGVADENSGHAVPASSDRLLLDPQRVRMEALRKLGLLRSDDTEPNPNLSPKLSPQTRRSWAAPSSPVSPRTPPSTLSYPRIHSPSPASFPLQSSPAGSPSGTLAAPVIQAPEILPAPDAFSDPEGAQPSEYELSAGKDVSEGTPPLTPPAMVKHLTPPKILGVKSATLERSGPGLSSYMAGQNFDVADISGKLSPSQMRNNRPRPASLGSRKEFSSTQKDGTKLIGATSREPDLRRSLPVPQPSDNSQKLPRSQGISVLICPRAENGDDRREALRRLGLLRD